MRRRLAWGVALPLALAGHAGRARARVCTRLPAGELARRSSRSRRGTRTSCGSPLSSHGAGACRAPLARGHRARRRARPPRARRARVGVRAPRRRQSSCLQEILELSLHTGTFGWHAVLAPTFLPGLAAPAPVRARRLSRRAPAPARGESTSASHSPARGSPASAQVFSPSCGCSRPSCAPSLRSSLRAARRASSESDPTDFDEGET